ncbi:MAG: cyclic nucleotide-binding domain-containing protein [Desulfurivibrionaceae bacterium]|nr:cyclic nucleotide-binding domain-containing protein [Desulfurivibrionaceae bacterium]
MAEETGAQLLAHSSREEAVRQLYELIVEAVEQGDFARADGLRLKLIATDDMALTEIIGSAEIIEAAKSAAIDPSFHEQWQALAAELSAEENNGFYFALKEALLRPGQAFIEQNKINNRLFFITKGQANIVCQQGERQILCQQLKAGDIVGEDTFFGISICTTSVICQSPVVVKYLDRRILGEWRQALPGLEEKLRAYCRQHSPLAQAQVAQKCERRRTTRHPLTASVSAQLQNLQGHNIGASFRGILDDISAGGLCFYIKSSSKSMARMLLGRPVDLTLTLGQGEIGLQGVIVSSKYHAGTDYTVHVKLTHEENPLFRQLLEEQEGGGAGR